MQKLLLFLIGLLLIALGVQGVLIAAVGVSTTATVTAIDRTGDRSEYNYKVSYRFTASNGKQYTGRYTENNVYSIAKLPATGSAIAVKYFRPMPGFSQPARKAGVTLTSLGSLALGVLIIVLGGSGRVRLGRAA